MLRGWGEKITTSRVQFIRKVALPGALPGFFTGLRLAVMTGWAPAQGQPKPLAPGSGRVSLARVLGELGRAVEARARDAEGHAARDGSANHDRRSGDEALA